MKYGLMFLVVGLLVCSLAYADIPRQVNFQGRLTDSSGKFVPDGNYSLTFRIYTDSTGGSAKWSEGQSVAVSKGLFNVILGITTPIPDSVFNYSNTWLGIQAGADPEMTPRQKLSSLGYAYYASNSDKLDGLHASDFSGSAPDYGRPGVAADLYEGASTLTSKYVNVSGPDSVYSTSGTAFTGKVSGNSDSALNGIQGYGDNSLSGDAYGGFFSTSSSGTGVHYGVRGEGLGSSATPTYGSYGYASNTSTGYTYGGYFKTTLSGTGVHYGVRGDGLGSSGFPTYAFYGFAANTSTGPTYGGYFQTTLDGTGYDYGVYGAGLGSSSSSTYGSYGFGSNTSSGNAYGGYFTTSSSGTGIHYGVRGEGLSSSAFVAYGSSGYASNTATGEAIGGYFTTSSSGTGTHYGVYGGGSGSSASPTYGCYGYAYNSSSGSALAGYFSTSASGTGTHYGVYAIEDAGGSGAAIYAGGDFAASGTKNAVLRTSKGHRLMSVIESPEVWFEDFGEGQLVNGKAHIDLDPLFLETVTINNLNPTKVFIQLTSGEPMNLVVNKGTTGFDVIASDNTSNSTFDYRIVAKRKGYETERMRETDVGKDDPNLYPELWSQMEKKQEEEKARMEEEQRLREKEQGQMKVEPIRMNEQINPIEKR